MPESFFGIEISLPLII